MNSPTQMQLDNEADDHVIVADEALEAFEAWHQGSGGTVPTVTRDDPPDGVDVWIVYEAANIADSHIKPTALGMASWVDAAGNEHIVCSSRVAEITLTVNEIKALGI